jgi:hypothetical protein
MLFEGRVARGADRSTLARECSETPGAAGGAPRVRSRGSWGATFATGLYCACVAGTSIRWVSRGVEIWLIVILALGTGLSVLAREFSGTPGAAGDTSRARSCGARTGFGLLDVTRAFSAIVIEDTDAVVAFGAAIWARSGVGAVDL